MVSMPCFWFIWFAFGLVGVFAMYWTIEHMAIVCRAEDREVPVWTVGRYAFNGLLTLIAGPLGLAWRGYWCIYHVRVSAKVRAEETRPTDTSATVSGRDDASLEESE